MKNKLIAGIAASAVLIGALAATPAQSQNRDYRWGNDNNRYSPYYGRQVGDNSYERHNKKNNNDAIIAGVAGLIIGGMIVSAAQKQQPQQPYPEPQYPVYAPAPPLVYVPTTVCRYEWATDYDGSYIRDGYGRPYQVRRCWTQ